MGDETRKLSLLLIDDDADFRVSTSRALGRRGFEVSQAESGEQAVEMLASVAPDVVLLDLRMGGMDGIATLRKLRELDEDLPVIILTGHGSFQDAFAGIHLEVVEFLQKPVDMDELATRVRTLMRRPDPLRERTIAEVMVPLDSYNKVVADAPVSVALKALQYACFQPVPGSVEQGHRSVLVHDRQGDFLGLIRIADVVALSIPPLLRGSPYTTCFAGMFLAQCKTIGNLKVADLLSETPTIDIDAPLMEAVNLLVANHQINLPVMRDGRIVGILRDKDILLEITDQVLVE